MASGPAAADDDPLLFLDDYELLSTLGEGSYAKVKLGRHLQTGTEVAVKVIPPQGQEWPVLQEARCMLGLRHPNIVQLFQVIETQEALFLVMELMSRGDLGGHLRTHGRLAEGEARRLFRQLVSALHYCHGRGVIHRDVKPQNVLLDLHGNARLADFSLSSPFGRDKLSTLCGTPVYTAPEILRGEDYAGPPVDIWSLGVVLYEMVTGTIPFQGKDLNDLSRKVRRGVYRVPPFLSPELQHLLRTLITLNPEDRSSLREVMPDAWVNQGHAEELRPFAEPGGEDLDPGVEREMLALGFAREDIRSSLAHQAYDRTMATYLILAAERARAPSTTILVRPRGAADPHGSGHSRHQDADTQQPGPEAEESAGPSGRAVPGVAAAGRSPPSRKASVQPRAKQTKASRGHSPQLPRPVRRPGRKLRTGPARTRPQARTARPRTSRTSGIAALPADRGSCVDADSRSTPPPPALDADSGATPPPPVLAWESRRTPPRPRPEEAKATPPPPGLDADSSPTPPPPGPEEARATPPPPALDSDSRPTPPPPALDTDSGPSPPPPALDADSGPSPPPPALDARPSPPPPAPEELSSEGERQGRRGLARRCLKFLRRLCCLPAKTWHHKNNRVQPL